MTMCYETVEEARAELQRAGLPADLIIRRVLLDTAQPIGGNVVPLKG
jgi:hypothetical protein